MQCGGFLARAAILASGLLILGGCGERWDAYVYPDKTRLSFSAHLGPFESLDACRSAARARLSEFSRQPVPGVVGDYECGKNCDDGKKLGGVAICDETVR